MPYADKETRLAYFRRRNSEKRQQDPDWYRDYYQKNRERILEQRRQYRAANPNSNSSRLRNLDYRQMVYGLLAQRDGHDCWICGQLIEPGSQSIDHVMPRCIGGDNTPDNLRLAHRVCNLRRPRKGYQSDK